MKIGTEQGWQAARKELLGAERELEEHAKRVEEQRRELPWVAVDKQYTFATEDGPRSLPALFEGRSQLLIYHLMFGEDWEVACPGCSSLADGLGGGVEHLNDRDVTLLCMSQAPIEKLVAYKRRRGWTVPYVSAHSGDFLFDYGYAFRRDEMSGIVREEFDMGQLLREAPQWLRDYREDDGAPTLRCDPDLPRAAVAWTPSTLGQPRVFEFVDQLHHRAWIDAHVGAQLLLNSPFPGPEHVEQREQRGREANRVERLRRSGV